MSGELNIPAAGKINYRALGTIIGLVLGITFDSIPVFCAIGLRFGAALLKRHREVTG